ncbi:MULTISPECIES: glutathione S-transferase family protein [Phenylobacterium]|uniref:Glutathione S-transferase n=1 Tax=Phenylobacterium koreense TaxID=266125 RepID=A0ABV2EIU7_9CAUL
MITLYGFGESFGLPEACPQVIKAEAQLRMAGLAYVKALSVPMPGRRLPWIEDDGRSVAGSHFIRLHLERKYGIDFDSGLGAVERAQAWAIERMIENQSGRGSEAEILAQGVRSLSALAALLGDRPFLMGLRPTAVDAAALGLLAGLTRPGCEALLRRALTFGRLTAYVDRMMAGVYPEFAWTPLDFPDVAVAA